MDYKCHWCKKKIDKDAKICPYCKRPNHNANNTISLIINLVVACIGVGIIFYFMMKYYG